MAVIRWILEFLGIREGEEAEKSESGGYGQSYGQSYGSTEDDQ